MIRYFISRRRAALWCKLWGMMYGLLLFTATPAIATPLIADLSNYRINIDSGFNGTRIFVFGARNDNGDIAVVIRGPNKNYIIRKKEEIGGIWVNRDRMKFFNVPDFYVVASSKPIEEMTQGSVFRQLSIGETNLLSPPPDPKTRASYDQFSEAFLRYQHMRRLYAYAPHIVTFMGETLFKTVIDFPDNIPPGDYTAEIYLLSDGDVMGMQSIPIKVNKSGLDAFLYSYAHDSPIIYGFSAVVIALAAGWFAGRMFEKI